MVVVDCHIVYPTRCFGIDSSHGAFLMGTGVFGKRQCVRGWQFAIHARYQINQAGMRSSTMRIEEDRPEEVRAEYW